jgi:hypothetical protein
LTTLEVNIDFIHKSLLKYKQDAEYYEYTDDTTEIKEYIVLLLSVLKEKISNLNSRIKTLLQNLENEYNKYDEKAENDPEVSNINN